METERYGWTENGSTNFPGNWRRDTRDVRCCEGCCSGPEQRRCGWDHRGERLRTIHRGRRRRSSRRRRPWWIVGPLRLILPQAPATAMRRSPLPINALIAIHAMPVPTDSAHRLARTESSAATATASSTAAVARDSALAIAKPASTAPAGRVARRESFAASVSAPLVKTAATHWNARKVCAARMRVASLAARISIALPTRNAVNTRDAGSAAKIWIAPMAATVRAGHVVAVRRIPA